MSAGVGFSGGEVWKAECPAGVAALRRWPESYPSSRLPVLHELQRLARETGLECVPEPIPCRMGTTHVTVAGQQWSLEGWRPGTPELLRSPTPARIAAAVDLLSAWHASLTAKAVRERADLLALPAVVAAFRAGRRCPSPGLARRSHEWDRLHRLRWYCRPTPAEDPLELAGRTEAAVRRYTPWLQRRLASTDVPVALRVCLRDVHEHHVLFEGAEVSGLIDFGAVGIDTPACDIGRLFARLLFLMPELWQHALERFGQRGVSDDLHLAVTFAVTGVILGALHWWEWLLVERRWFPDPAAAYGRWRDLVELLEVSDPAQWDNIPSTGSK